MLIHRVAQAFLVWFLFTQAVHSGDASNQGNAGGGDRTADTKYGLNLSVKLDRETYRLADDPKMTIYLKNVGPSAITLYKKMGWGASSSLFLGVADANGNWLDKNVLNDHKDRPPFAREDFTALEPGQSFEIRAWLSLDGEGVTGPGRYSVSVWYQSPVSVNFAPKGMTVFVRENGSLQAKPVSFEVTK